MGTESERTPPPRPIRWSQEILLLLAVVLLLCAADQWTKGWAVERLGPLKRDFTGRLRPPPDKLPVDVIDGALQFNITGNEGAIWGLGGKINNRIKRPFLITLSLLAMGFIIMLVRSSTQEQRLRRLGLAAVLSGAVGNLIDRIGQDYVVDFVDWYYAYNWPTFNVADVAITLGVVMVIIDLYWHPDPTEEDPGFWWPQGRKARTARQKALLEANSGAAAPGGTEAPDAAETPNAAEQDRAS